MASKPGISAVVITLNEQRNIARCLDSLEEVADELIVVDAHSTDETEHISRERGARFFRHTWKDFATAKNFGIEEANFDHVLSLDADEALSSELRASILEAKRRGLEGAYSFNRLTNYCGRWIRRLGWYPDTKLRLFPRNGATWVGDYVHEEAMAAPGIAVTRLEGDLLHYSYTDFVEHRERADTYSRLKARKLFESGRGPSLWRPLLSPVGRFVKMYLLKLGVLEGSMGWRISWISAQSNALKYRELNRLNREGRRGESS